MPGGFQKARGQVVRGSDPLPTADVIAMVKAEAWARSCRRALACGWPPTRLATNDLERDAPTLALAALSTLCPQVDTARLARCLGLDATDAKADLFRAEARGGWLVEQAAQIAVEVRGGDQ